MLLPPPRQTTQTNRCPPGSEQLSPPLTAGCRPAGAVVHADIVMGPDGRSKGWGVVAFATPSDAQAAIQLLNGSNLEGRIVSAKLDQYSGR